MRQSPGRPGSRQRSEQDAGCSSQVSGGIRGQYSLQGRHARSNAGDLLPDIGSGRWPDGDQPFCLGGQKKIEDERSFQQGIDGKNDARRFSAPNDPMGLGKIRHHEGDHVLSLDAELPEHIGCLSNLAQPFAVCPTPGSPIVRCGQEEGKRPRLRRSCRALHQQLVSAFFGFDQNSAYFAPAARHHARLE